MKDKIRFNIKFISVLCPALNDMVYLETCKKCPDYVNQNCTYWDKRHEKDS